MPDTAAPQFVGRGIYEVAEAARLAQVPGRRVRRWLQGYAFLSGAAAHESPPVWEGSLPQVDGRLALSFRDLLEVRFVDAFRRAGVSWPTIRKAASRARELLGTGHPFSTARFKTDGRAIFAEVRDDANEPAVVELVQRQRYFTSVISPYLKGIEFDGNEPIRWWPMGMSRRIVIDPERAFGQPILCDAGVPTALLLQAYRVTQSVDDVARWYEVAAAAVRSALEYEQSLAA